MESDAVVSEGASSVSAVEERTVEVRFLTKLEEYRVTETPFRLPVKLGRMGLSGVINHLLSLEPAKPFDFIINNEFLRSSLDEYLKQKQLTTENLIELEYVEALTAPEPKQEFQHDDWIASIDVHSAMYFTGNYDGAMRLWGTQGQSLLTSAPHNKPITCVRVSQKSNGDYAVLTSSQDHTIRVFDVVAQTETPSCTLRLVCKGHTDTVTSVDFSKVNPNKIVSSSWDKTIRIWDLQNVTQPEDKPSASSKKRKVVKSPEVNTSYPIDGHSQVVSKVQWISANNFISGSWDGSLRMWDASTLSTTAVLNGNKTVLTFDYSPLSTFVASGHDDHAIRIWDFRAENNAVSKVLKSHVGFVGSVKWHATSPYLLVSASHDKTVKVWDIRSTIPLHTLTGHTDKVLAVTWDGDKIVSGGADTKLKTWEFKNPLPK